MHEQGTTNNRPSNAEPKEASPAAAWVYLIHFDLPLAHAQHYLGATTDLDGRLADHAAGKGARLLQVLTTLGRTYRVVRLWTFDVAIEAFHFERKLKRVRKNHRRLCPICLKSAVKSVLPSVRK